MLRNSVRHPSGKSDQLLGESLYRTPIRGLLGFPGSRILLYGGLLRLICHSRITSCFHLRPHVTVQPAAGSLIPSDQSTNLS